MTTIVIRAWTHAVHSDTAPRDQQLSFLDSASAVLHAIQLFAAACHMHHDYSWHARASLLICNTMQKWSGQIRLTIPWNQGIPGPLLRRAGC